MEENGGVGGKSCFSNFSHIILQKHYFNLHYPTQNRETNRLVVLSSKNMLSFKSYRPKTEKSSISLLPQ